MKTKLIDVADVIRSKNSGPYEITFDIIFKNSDVFNKVSNAKVISKDLIAKLYNITVDKVINVIEFEAANAIKSTIVRPFPSGALGECDVYGAQQHAPLLNLEFDI